VVAIQVRRAAIHSAANLGVQPHHQSTSAVPTIMLITTSLVYVLFQTMRGILYVLWRWAMSSRSNFSRETFVVVDICFFVVYIIYRPIYAYNFYVYLITGKLFRSDLYVNLFVALFFFFCSCSCYCSCSCSWRSGSYRYCCCCCCWWWWWWWWSWGSWWWCKTC